MSTLFATSLRNRLETHPPTVLKAAFVHMWIRLDMTIANSTSFNLSSVFDNGVGVFVCNLSCSLIDGGYQGAASAQRVTNNIGSGAQLDGRTAWSCRLAMVENNAVIDVPYYTAMACGVRA